MTGASGLDIRLPIGGLFVVLGVLVGGYGVATGGDTARYAVSEGININLWWGLVMLVFGLLNAGRLGQAARNGVLPSRRRNRRRAGDRGPGAPARPGA